MKRWLLAALVLSSASCFAFNIGGYKLGMKNDEAAKTLGLSRCTVQKNWARCRPMALEIVGSTPAISSVSFEDKRISEITLSLPLETRSDSSYWQGNLAGYQSLLDLKECTTVGRIVHVGPGRRLPDRIWTMRCTKGLEAYREIKLSASTSGGGWLEVTVKKDRAAVRRLAKELADEKAKDKRKYDALKFQEGG